MKRMFACLIYLSAILFSCQSTEVTSEEKPQYNQLENFCDTFLMSHSNWKQNDIVNEKVNVDLKQYLSSKISQGLLSDFPMRLLLINEYQPGKYAAHFSTLYTVQTKYVYHFDVIALIKKDEGEKLKTDSLYGLSGEFKNFLHSDFNQYTYGMVYSPVVRVTKHEVYQDSAAFDLGVILMDKTIVKRIKTNKN